MLPTFILRGKFNNKPSGLEISAWVASHRSTNPWLYRSTFIFSTAPLPGSLMPQSSRGRQKNPNSKLEYFTIKEVGNT